MRLVLDSNRLFAALIRNSVARAIILNPTIEFIAPDYLLNEVMKHETELINKSKLPDDEFDLLFESIFENINVVPYEEIKPCYEQAKEIMEHIDPDDAVFLALVLCSPNDGIWTEDMHFDKQNLAKVWKTNELMEVLGLEK